MPRKALPTFLVSLYGVELKGRCRKGRTLMSQTKDIRDAVESDLTFDPDVDASGITVEDRDGDVVLSGSVPSYPQYLEAVAVARRVAGVKNVQNRLEVALSPGDRRDDSSLTATANDALTLGHSIAVGVEARAENGGIILTGAVRNGTERAAAEAMIASLTGVRSVTNDIRLRADATPLPPYPGPAAQA
jgi:osmotically-inducible protein OsmY